MIFRISPEPAPQNAYEGSLELSTGTGIDNGIHHRVTVSQPEDDLEKPARDMACGTQCFWKYTM